MSQESNEPLRAADFAPRSERPPGDDTPAQSHRKSAWLVGTIGIALLGFVVFVLPSLTSAPSTITDSDRSRTDRSAAPAATPARGDTSSERSPFAEAQVAKARRAAQEALQSLLEVQTRLESRAVDLWAGEDFQRAQTTATEGDGFYREQNFRDAEVRYDEALAMLEILESRLPTDIESRLSDLLDAIESSDDARAKRLAGVLLRMAPDSADVFDASERVAVIPEVADLIDEAADLFSQGAVAEALSTTQRARALDAAHERLASLEMRYALALTNQQFQSEMTQGFAALEVDGFDNARAAFRRAQTLKPEDASPAVALAQVDEAELITELNRLLRSATDFVDTEEWQSAESAYRQALALDPNLAQASDGLAIAAPMASLFMRLAAIVDTAARLVDPAVLRAAQTTVTEAELALETRVTSSTVESAALPGSMPKLARLTADASEVVRVASTPLPVTLTSDDLTDITIKRVARLGRVNEQIVTLRPGQYQVLGSRDGYRDVLKTLNVRANSTNQLDIRCQEPIVR